VDHPATNESEAEAVFRQMEADNQACLNKREPGEPMFIILGRDPDGGTIVRLWGERRTQAGEPEHGAKAIAIADLMDEWAKEHRPHSAPASDAYPELSPEPVAIRSVDELERRLAAFFNQREFGSEEPEDNPDWRQGFLAALSCLRETLKPWWPFAGTLSLAANDAASVLAKATSVRDIPGRSKDSTREAVSSAASQDEANAVGHDTVKWLADLLRESDPETGDEEWSYEPQAEAMLRNERFAAALKAAGAS